MSYVKFDTPEKLQDELKRLLDTIADTRGSKIRKGMNETTKSIERSTAKLVVMAENVTPPEIVLHLPILCEEKGIPYGYVGKQEDLGHAVRINVSASAIAVEDAGSSQNERELESMAERLQNLK
ncbi:MAG: 50S ribosomal protein L7ae [Promethearchaeota archaeon]|nr:MAG: 50S ribosomal protein L7ae [Candidatus Lokiarchaeota archaeon]